MRRARETAGLTVRDAAAEASTILTTSYRTIARLEESRDVPTGSRQLAAYVALLVYGYDPDDFGLADSKASTLVDKRAVVRQLAARHPAWVTAVDLDVAA